MEFDTGPDVQPGHDITVSPFVRVFEIVHIPAAAHVINTPLTNTAAGGTCATKNRSLLTDIRRPPPCGLCPSGRKIRAAADTNQK